MRFRKRIKVFPGFHLNFSSSGVSTSIGPRGASINISQRGTYLNTTVPGLGLSFSHRLDQRPSVSEHPSAPSLPASHSGQPAAALRGEIKSAHVSELTSASLADLKKTLSEAYDDRRDLHVEIADTHKKINTCKTLHTVAILFLVGIFYKGFKKRADDATDYLADLEQQLQNSHVDLDILFDQPFETRYSHLSDQYRKLTTSNRIWDITSAMHQDRKLTRSAASTVVTRTDVRFRHEHFDTIKSAYPAFHLENKNGGDLYIYPAFAIMLSSHKDFALIDINDLDIEFTSTRFIEEEKVPSDSEIIDHTWAKVNKNGQPDRRFKDNYQIPVVRYGDLHISSASGLNESYSFSNYAYAEAFAKAFNSYKSML